MNVDDAVAGPMSSRPGIATEAVNNALEQLLAAEAVRCTMRLLIVNLHLEPTLEVMQINPASLDISAHIRKRHDVVVVDGGFGTPPPQLVTLVPYSAR